MFVVQPEFSWWDIGDWSEGKALPEGFKYGSDNNPHWLTVQELQDMVATL